MHALVLAIVGAAMKNIIDLTFDSGRPKMKSSQRV